MPADRYEVVTTREAEKDLDDLRGLRDQAVREILRLEGSPELGHAMSGALRGARSLVFNMPGGAYRALYVIREEKQRCLVFQVGPHEGIYGKATRRRYEAAKKAK